MQKSVLLLTFLAALAALVAITATGCGSSNSSLTKAEYVRQADAICKKAEKNKKAQIEAFLQENAPPSGKKLSLEEEAKLATDFTTRAVLPSLRTEADELAGLDGPNNEEEKANAIIEGFDEVVQKLEGNAAIIATKPDPFEKVARMARDYGFQTCIVHY
jgi:hypothetical protein